MALRHARRAAHAQQRVSIVLAAAAHRRFPKQRWARAALRPQLEALAAHASAGAMRAEGAEHVCTEKAVVCLEYAAGIEAHKVPGHHDALRGRSAHAQGERDGARAGGRQLARAAVLRRRVA